MSFWWTWKMRGTASYQRAQHSLNCDKMSVREFVSFWEWTLVIILLAQKGTIAQDSSTSTPVLEFMQGFISLQIDDLQRAFELLQQQVVLPAENADHIDTFLPSMLQSSAAMYQGSPRGRQGSRPQHTNITELPPDTDTQCGQLKRQQLTAIETALKSDDDYSVQRGWQDWGFLRDDQEADDCVDQNCALSNPSSPYALTILPKARPVPADVHDSTKNMVQSSSDGDSVSSGVAAAFAAAFEYGNDSGNGTNGESGRDSKSQSGGPSGGGSNFPLLSSVLPDLLGGPDTSPGEGILIGRDQEEDASAAYQLAAQEVVVVAGCIPAAEVSRYFSFTGYVHSIRTSRGWSTVFGSMGDSLSAYTVPSSSSTGALDGVRNRLNSTLPPDSGIDSEDPYGKFTVVIMTASRQAAQDVESLIAPILEQEGLQSSVNLIPIPFPFNENMPTGTAEQHTSPYYMLLARNIVPDGKLEAFKEYTQGQPFAVWRMTPKEYRRWDPQGPDAFPTPQVISRKPSSPFQIKGIDGKEGLLDINRKGEAVLRPALEWLLDRMDAELFGSLEHPSGAAGRWPSRSRGLAAAAWNLGSEPGLSVAGVDWGVDCYRREARFCSGDNRDATYILSLPLATLDTDQKVLYLIGVNHVETGLATFINIAPTDIVLRLGLEAWATPEMTGTADDIMQDGPYSSLSHLFWVVAFARDCTGIPNCKEIPTEGPRSLPLSRGALLMLRAYVMPETGVGPPDDYLLNFRAVVATPVRQARLRDWRRRLDFEVVENSACRRALVNTATSCARDLGSTNDVWIGGGLGRARNESGFSAGGLLNGANLDLNFDRPVRESECCQASEHWVNERCHCSDEGQSLVDTLDAGPLMRGLTRVCGTGRGLFFSCLL